MQIEINFDFEKEYFLVNCLEQQTYFSSAIKVKWVVEPIKINRVGRLKDKPPSLEAQAECDRRNEGETDENRD